MIKTDRLLLDPLNPRLAGKEGRTDQPALLETLWTQGSLDELTGSIYENGFFPEEPLFAVIEDGKYIVVEGNRRLAAVKLLRDETLQKTIRATDVPKLAKSDRLALDELPVSVYPNRASLWAFLGFRHVNGPLTWDSWSKAQYIANVRSEFGVNLDEIANAIGDKNQTVRRLYRGLMVLNQSADQAGYKLEERYKQHLSFSHLYTGLDYSGFERHLGLGKDDGFKPNPVPKSHLSNLKELMVWLFGSKEDGQQPVVRAQNPDLKRLDDVLKDKKALSALRSGLGLEVSHQISLGDGVRFREALTRVKYDLQQAKGLVVSGYKGESDLLRTAKDIVELGESLIDEMDKRSHLKQTRRGDKL